MDSRRNFQVDLFPVGWPPPAEGQDLVDEVTCPLAGLPYDLKQGAIVTVLGQFPADRQQGDNWHKGIIKVVGDAAGERAQRFHPLCLQQLDLEFPTPLLDGTHLGYILERAEEAGDLAGLIEYRVAFAPDNPNLAVGPDHAEFACCVASPASRDPIRGARRITASRSAG